MEPGETVSFTKCYKKSLPLFFFCLNYYFLYDVNYNRNIIFRSGRA